MCLSLPPPLPAGRGWRAGRKMASPVARIASGVLVAALLAATVFAFVYTEKLKLTKSPITGTLVDKVFSPVCDCDTAAARITFRLRRPDVIGAEIVDGDGDVVRELVRSRAQGAGRVFLVWDGRDESGAVVSEGSYRPRIRLRQQRRTITLPNPITVDVTAPVVERYAVAPRVISPDGDGRRDAAVARYRLSERAQAMLYVDGRRQVVKRGTRREGTIRWQGEIDGEPAVKGLYRLTLRAVDLAGNASLRSDPAVVRVRFVELGRRRIEVEPGGRFAVLVVTDAPTVRWRFAGRTGTAPRGSLRLTAPEAPGRYALVVRANGHAARATVVVREPAP